MKNGHRVGRLARAALALCLPLTLAGSVQAGPPHDGMHYIVWEDIGGASAGAHGEPALAMHGFTSPGHTIQANLTNALENAPALLLVAFEPNAPLAYQGGILHAAPVALVVEGVTDETGTLHLQGKWKAGLEASSLVYFQCVIADRDAPGGLALSNAMVFVVID
jgi:hypothetical protein